MRKLWKGVVVCIEEMIDRLVVISACGTHKNGEGLG